MNIPTKKNWGAAKGSPYPPSLSPSLGQEIAIFEDSKTRSEEWVPSEEKDREESEESEESEEEVHVVIEDGGFEEPSNSKVGPGLD